MSASYIHCSNSSPAMLYSSYPKMFSSTFLWECHGRPWGDCEKTFPNGTHIHRRHTCCLFDAPYLNKCWIMTQPPKYLNLTTLTCLCHTARSRTMLSRPSFGYSDQTSELAPIGKWHFQYPPGLNDSNRNDLFPNSINQATKMKQYGNKVGLDGICMDGYYKWLVLPPHGLNPWEDAILPPHELNRWEDARHFIVSVKRMSYHPTQLR